MWIWWVLGALASEDVTVPVTDLLPSDLGVLVDANFRPIVGSDRNIVSGGVKARVLPGETRTPRYAHVR